MALHYFLYDTTYGNTVIDWSDNSFSPVSPYEEILFDFNIPDIQPSYLYCVTDDTVVINSQENIDNYLNSIENIPAPTDYVNYGQYSETTELINQKIITISGLTTASGLQEVTTINAVTNIESTFNGGLVVNNLRPTGDTVNAIQINNLMVLHQLLI